MEIELERFGRGEARESLCAEYRRSSQVLLMLMRTGQIAQKPHTFKNICSEKKTKTKTKTEDKSINK